MTTLSDRLGQCYPLSYRYATRRPGRTLVHGSIQGMGQPRIGHAWVRNPDGTVHEPATDEDWSADLFQAFFTPAWGEHSHEHESVEFPVSG